MRNSRLNNKRLLIQFLRKITKRHSKNHSKKNSNYRQQQQQQQLFKSTCDDNIPSAFCCFWSSCKIEFRAHRFPVAVCLSSSQLCRQVSANKKKREDKSVTTQHIYYCKLFGRHAPSYLTFPPLFIPRYLFVLYFSCAVVYVNK